MSTISADDLATIWPEAVVIDVRSAEEYATAHIPGSRNIPLNDLASRLKDVPGTTVHVLCGSGKRSSQAVQMLNERGYNTVNISPAESPSGTATATPSPTHHQRQGTTPQDADPWPLP